ncbi:MAG: VTT domain-containing protein [Promethearchaeota archaeon]|jgi:membrane protein YqaA with SNARE-associated domain
MPISKKLTIVFIIFYLTVIVYILLFISVPDIQKAVIQSRQNLTVLTKGPNYFWALVISLFICFLGSASIGFPIPFPFILFSLSNSLISNYSNLGYEIDQILQLGSFWFEIVGLALVGGLGSALGEFTGYGVGYGTKKIVDEKKSDVLDNIDGFGRIILQNEKRAPIYIFLFALTPLPDDILFLPLGMLKYPFWKCIIPAWLGKNFTILFYCLWPIFVKLGLTRQEIFNNDMSSIITEAVLLLVTITVMFFIMSFNWVKFIEKRRSRKENNKK